MKIKQYNLDGSYEEIEMVHEINPIDLKFSRIKLLEYWFEQYFDRQLKQSLWQQDFKPSYDNILKQSYANIESLKEKAESVRQELKSLREEVQNALQ